MAARDWRFVMMGNLPFHRAGRRGNGAIPATAQHGSRISGRLGKQAGPPGLACQLRDGHPGQRAGEIRHAMGASRHYPLPCLAAPASSRSWA